MKSDITVNFAGAERGAGRGDAWERVPWVLYAEAVCRKQDSLLVLLGVVIWEGLLGWLRWQDTVVVLPNDQNMPTRSGMDRAKYARRSRFFSCNASWVRQKTKVISGWHPGMGHSG